MPKKLTERRLDRMAMLAWSITNNVRAHLETRWNFVREDPVTDKYREIAKALAKECGYVDQP
ncbi:hypothetical protein HJB53_30085 [Rhizobium lentis]|nr:hypothetical protein [Rhizobium lentis]